MVYDENIKDWAPRWGAFSVKKNEKEANGGFIELGKNDDPYENPFKKRDLGKKLEKEKH